MNWLILIGLSDAGLANESLLVTNKRRFRFRQKNTKGSFDKPSFSNNKKFQFTLLRFFRSRHTSALNSGNVGRRRNAHSDTTLGFYLQPRCSFFFSPSQWSKICWTGFGKKNSLHAKLVPMSKVARSWRLYWSQKNWNFRALLAVHLHLRKMS